MGDFTVHLNLFKSNVHGVELNWSILRGDRFPKSFVCRGVRNVRFYSTSCCTSQPHIGLVAGLPASPSLPATLID